MIGRVPKSNAWFIECDTCGKRTVAHGENYFEIAFTAQAHGWTVTSDVYCSNCPPAEPAPARRRTRTA